MTDPFDFLFDEERDVESKKTLVKLRQTDLLYHGSIAPVNSVESKGLVPKFGKGADAWFEDKYGRQPRISGAKRGQSVYLTPDRKIAEQFAIYASVANGYKTPYIYTVRPPKNELVKFQEDEGDEYAVRYPGTIPPAWITSHEALSGSGLKAAQKRVAERL